MKRFTLILSLLVAMVTTAMAQQSITVSTEADPVYYVIASYNRGGYLTNVGVGSGVEHVALADGSYWYFESAGDDGSVYIVNKLKDGDSKIYLGSDKKASTTAAKWYILPNGVNNKGMSISSTNPISGSSCVDANNSNNGVGSWAPNAGDWHGTTWVFVDCVDGTYNPANLILRSRSDRYVETISLGENSATIDRDYAGDYGRAYFDLTKSVTFEVYAGQVVTPAITRNGNWTNAYAYIDLAGDGFTASVGENGAPGDDLVSYSFYSGDEANDTEGKNSIGESLSTSARNTIAMPSFTAPSEPGTYRMRFKHDWNSINPNGSNANFMSNGGSIIDVKLIVKEVVATATVNYSYQFNGVEKFTQTSTGYVGDEYPALTETAKFPYGITATKPAGLIAESDITDGVINKVIELKSNLPFAFADSYENINKWYYIQMHSSGGALSRFLQYAETYIEWADVTRTTSENDTYTWGFIGDPFTGFKLVNYGAPADANAVVSASDSGNPGFGAIADAVVWSVKASRTNADSEHFCFQYPGSSNYMNAQSGKVSFWWDSDQGSTMWVTERDMTGLADLQALIGQVEAAIAAYGEGGTTVGYYTAESTAALATALAAAKIAAEANTSAAANAAAQTALQNAVAALEIIMPEEGKFYRIVSHCTKDHRANQEVYVSKDGDMHFGKIADNVAAGTIGHIFQFVPAADGKFYIYNVQRGVYMQALGAQGTPAVVTTDIEKAKPVAIKHLGVDNVIGIYPDGQNMMHAQDASSKIVGWNSTDVTDASAWVITEVANITELYQEVTIGEAGYATLYLGCAVTIPEGVEAYAVSEINEGYVNMAAVTGAIPANEAVILKLAKGASAGTFNFVYAESADGVEKNLLEGTTVDANIAEAAYVLGQVEGAVGLYKAKYNVSTDTTNDGTAEEPAVTYEAWLNNANKAYLPASVASGAASYSFRFGEGTTGINEVTTESGNVKGIYDLTGRRVEAITAPGIYVVNGKKVLVK